MKILSIVLLLISTNVFADYTVESTGTISATCTVYDETIVKATLLSKKFKNQVVFKAGCSSTDNPHIKVDTELYNCKTHVVYSIYEDNTEKTYWVAPNTILRALGEYACKVAYPVY